MPQMTANHDISNPFADRNDPALLNKFDYCFTPTDTEAYWGGWSHYTDNNEPVDGNGAQIMVPVQSWFRTRDLSITGPTRLPPSLTGPTLLNNFYKKQYMDMRWIGNMEEFGLERQPAFRFVLRNRPKKPELHL
jgi:hypothetical protein